MPYQYPSCKKQWHPITCMKVPRRCPYCAEKGHNVMGVPWFGRVRE